MKKYLIALSAAALLAGCSYSSKPVKEEMKTEKTQVMQEKEKIVMHYTGENNKPLTIQSQDGFETAHLFYDKKIVKMKRGVSGSGVLMEDSKKTTSFHFKEGDGGMLTMPGQKDMWFKQYIKK